MDIRSLLQTMYTINEGETKETPKGREHKGTYGTSHGKEDVRDQYGHKIGKVNKGAADKKDAPKKGRGRPKKGSDDSGEVKSYDTKSLGDVFGGGKKPSKEVGKKSVKHSLKDWIEASEQKSLNEDGQFVTRPIPQQTTQLQQVIGPDGKPALNQPIPTSAALRVANALSSSDGAQGMAEDGKKKTMSRAADLPGKQEKLDVAKPKGKLDAKDFKALRDKKKVKESLSFNEMTGETTSEMQDMLAELQQDIDHYNTTGHCSDKLEAFLKIHGHAKKKITDEGQHTQHYMDANKPSIVRQHAEIAQAPNQHTPFKTDPIQAVTDRGVDAAQSMGKKASGFLKSLSPFSMTESKNMKDIQLENWEKELNSLLNEGITVSSSTGQQGSPDSVSINATDADAQELLSIVRQAGLGVFGGDKPQSNYGAPMHDNPEGHGTEPEMSPTVVGDDSDMLALIKKMTGIDMAPGGEEGSMDDGHGSDYEDEEGHGDEEGPDDTALQPAGDEESEEDGEEQVDERLSVIANPAGARSAEHAKEIGARAPQQNGQEPDFGIKIPSTLTPPTSAPSGGDTGEGKTTGSTSEDEMEEGNAFGNEVRQKKSDNIPNSQQRITTGGQNLPVKEEDHAREEGEETCNECGSSMYEGHECGTEAVEEGYSNETGHEELAQLKALLGMGNDMHRPKHSQATGNIQKVTMETKLMKQSSDLLVDFRKLSGIK